MSEPDTVHPEPLVQCEACLELVSEGDATFAEFPGITLAFCPGCTKHPMSYYGGL